MESSRKRILPGVSVAVPRRHHSESLALRVALAGLLLAFIALATWYSVAIPVGEGVDEIPHFDYVRYVKERRALPVQPWRDNGRDLEVWMGHHPPLYYVLGALVSFWTDTTDRETVLIPNPHFTWAENDPTNGWNVYLHSAAEAFPYRGTILAIHYLRLWSVVMGAVTVLAVYRIGRLVLPTRPWIALTAGALIAFNPSFVFMSSTIHHDSLMAMMYALSFWWMVRALRRFPRSGEALAGGLLLGAGLLTKLSGLSLIPLFGLTLLLIGRREGEWARVVRRGVLLYGSALLVSGWWYLRNQLLYGDPLGWEMFLGVHGHMVRSGPYTWFIFRHEFLGQLSRTFWGAFGYMHITFPETLRRFFWAGTGIALLAALLVAIRGGRLLRTGDHWRAWAVFLAAVALVFLSFVRFSMATTGAGHGRYLFTIAAPFALVLAIGLHALAWFRAERLVAGGVSAGMLVYAIVALLRFVLPLYAPPERADPEVVAAATPAGIVFGEALDLIAYELAPESVAPGEPAHLTLYWRAAGEQRPDLYVRVRLRDRFGTAFVEDEFWPAPSSSTAVWDRSTIYVTRRTLPIPPNAATGESPLEIVVQPGRDGEPLTARTGTGELAGSAPVVETLVVGRPSPAESGQVQPDHPRRERLGGTIELVGYDLASSRVRPGGQVDLTLYWRASRAIEGNFTVFVHLLDEDGRLVAQQDNEPNGGQYPTSAWTPGEPVRDPYSLALPPDLPPGRYSLVVGMYEWPSLERLTVTVDEVAQGDAIVLEAIVVE